jgi:glycosyltransferase involved in cell wall biosynthesis
MTESTVNKLRGRHIALVSTVPYFMVSQLSTQIQFLRSLGMQVTLITSPGDELETLPPGDDLTVIAMDIPRKQQPWRDLKALMRLYSEFRRGNFSIVHSTTPKAGLLCAIAGKLAGIPVRLHTFTGQAWLTRQGLIWSIMRFSDRMIVKLSTHCYADSPSQRQFLINEGIASAERISVNGKGSLAGVDLQRFSAALQTDEDKNGARKKSGIADAAFVITYIGRITRDKGLFELLAAFERLQQQCPDVELLLLGPIDEGGGQDIIRMAEEITHVHYLGYQSEPEHFLAITDVLCLPSYREGFGTVVIEAAAMAVPCVGSRISGLVDAIEDGVTGLLVPARDEEALYSALERLWQDREILARLAVQAQQRCEQEFASCFVNERVADEYIKWLQGMKS